MSDLNKLCQIQYKTSLKSIQTFQMGNHVIQLQSSGKLAYTEKLGTAPILKNDCHYFQNCGVFRDMFSSSRGDAKFDKFIYGQVKLVHNSLVESRGVQVRPYVFAQGLGVLKRRD